LYGCADFLVHAAIGEGFPLAVQEALACGLPVVLLWEPGYAASITREAVLACNSLDELSRAVRRLAGDAPLRTSLSRRGRREAEERWSWEATARSYAEVYRRLVAPERAGAPA
jgi:D-inositol-3-phosphate glycosyltransferase